MDVHEAIAQANAILPHVAAREGELDLRWQAIIGVGEFVDTEPLAVWEFTKRWASAADDDLRTALATCILEHLLEHHFSDMLPRVREAAVADPGVAALVAKCWALGSAAEPYNIQQFETLKAECAAWAI